MNISNKNSYFVISLILLLIILLSGCDYSDNKITEFTSDFESGSIGNVEQINDFEWTISLKNDNDDNTLPDTWRNWWYLRIDNAPTDRLMVINITKRGWPYYYVPVYSYDNKKWFRFREEEVTQAGDYELTIKKQFTYKQVWLARFYPYTYSQLKSYLTKFDLSPWIIKEVIGETVNKRPIIMLTITDFNVSNIGKKRIWIHARTHPAETGSSYLLEGLINFLLSNQIDARNALTQLIFHIIPMQNVDGVIAGNYRTNTDSRNLEVMWYPDTETPDPLDLSAFAPVEVQVLNRTIRDIIGKEAPFSMALNLHSSNSEPDTAAFFYPHFGPESLGYSSSEANLWGKQISFINSVSSYYNNRIEPLRSEGGSSFASKFYPESWWWKNFQDNIMAITMETVYGRGGFAPDWLTPVELRELGLAVGLSIMEWHNIPIKKYRKTNSIPRTFDRNSLQYPDLYPPKAEDEMKE